MSVLLPLVSKQHPKILFYCKDCLDLPPIHNCLALPSSNRIEVNDEKFSVEASGGWFSMGNQKLVFE